MKVVITGAAGFLGRKLARRLLDGAELVGRDGRSHTVGTLVLFDVVPVTGLNDPRVTTVTGEIYDTDLIARTIGGDTDSVFHFAAIVSSGAEADFDLGYRVNLDGTRAVLDACRALPHVPRVVFTSSVAAFGGDLPAVLDDDTPLRPQTSYGCQKAMGEFLVNDMSRKGDIDGRALRLPTIVVRPGKPNKAASTFASSILREPLTEATAVCPVARESRMWILSPRRVIEAFLHGHNLAPEDWGWNRSLNLPGIAVSIDDMVAALGQVAGQPTVDRIRWEPDPFIQQIVSGWPGSFETPRARDMGFNPDPSMTAIVEAFVEDDLAAQKAGTA